MKNIIFLLVSILFLWSCNKNDDTSGPTKLIGEWRLIEQYADPGDGSGDFITVISNKTITFLDNGNITSNGSLCSMNINSDEDTTGTYSASENSINPSNCISSDYVLSFQISGRNLIVSYPCIEGCQQKFEK